MRRLIASMLVGVVALSLAGCGKSPESVVETFYRDIEKGDITEAKSMLSSQIVAMLGDQKLTASMAKETEQISKCGGIKSITPTLETKGELVFGSVTIEFKGECKPKIEKVKLMKEDGKWKIGPNK